MGDKQKTLKSSISFEGVGLHTGEFARLTVYPAPDNHGLKFRRTDIKESPAFDALLKNVISTNRSTSLGKGNAEVHTTEHILASLYGLEVDNALLEIDGPEIPILDGSSEPFVKEIEKVGFQNQDAYRDYFVLRDNLYYEDENKYSEMMAVPTPGQEFRLTVMVDYNSPVLGTQHASMYDISEFRKEIASNRTFVFLKEIEFLAKNGLIKGGDLDNAIVLVERAYSEEEIKHILKLLGREKMQVKVEGIGVLNTVKLKHENEPARHKLLDIIGDLALVGKPIKGHILAARPGHKANVEFGKMIEELIKKEGTTPKVDLTKTPKYDINEIARMLPHRYPFLMVDKIMDISENEIIGVKNVTFNEPFFQGHFPENPVLPGVLQLEAMAQVGGIFALSKTDEPEKYSTYFMKIDKAKFKKKVIPGDTIVFQLRLISPLRRGIVHMEGKAFVNDQLVSEAEMMAQIIKDKA